ncbi:unnamed protein product [Cylicocyclus nassatus]|uniref:Centrosomal protein CEP104 N-terminal domain-containing protein n=1 Tax=Cylicocyclus nassatus TaxID=53992 RepID=A0AA36HAS1_CYLNA|nr:unnamed protein product [Cylicocyclus nassatus]
MSKERGLVELGWKCLVLGSQQPQEFNNGKWVSESNEEFPIDIVLGMDKISQIYKVIIETDEQYTPSKVEVCIGIGDDALERSYKNARMAEFSEIVEMEFDGSQRIANRMELRNAFESFPGQYMWLMVHEPDTTFSNRYKRVGFKKVTILGYPLSDAEIAELNSKIKNGNVNGRLNSRGSSRASSRPSSKSRRPASSQKDKQEKARYPPEGRYSYSGDGMHMNSEGLGGDPLSTVRLVKKVLKDKMEKANQEEREVEATVCLRGIQRLKEHEKMLEELSQKRSNALVHNETEQAERILLSMKDCRDTVLRSVHVDLLLGRDELRAIGIDSQWAE